MNGSEAATSPTITRRPDVCWRSVFDRTVVLPPEVSEPLYLSGTAERIWLLLDRPATVATLIDGLVADFGTNRAEIEADVEGFVQTLVAHGLVSLR